MCPCFFFESSCSSWLLNEVSSPYVTGTSSLPPLNLLTSFSFSQLVLASSDKLTYTVKARNKPKRLEIPDSVNLHFAFLATIVQHCHHSITSLQFHVLLLGNTLKKELFRGSIYRAMFHDIVYKHFYQGLDLLLVLIGLNCSECKFHFEYSREYKRNLRVAFIDLTKFMIRHLGKLYDGP